MWSKERGSVESADAVAEEEENDDMFAVVFVDIPSTPPPPLPPPRVGWDAPCCNISRGSSRQFKIMIWGITVTTLVREKRPEEKDEMKRK